MFKEDAIYNLLNRVLLNFLNPSAKIFILFFVTTLPAQSIKGVIVDENTGHPLPGAMIIIENTQYGAVSDFDGQFTIYDVQCGELVLTVSYIGYSIKNEPLTVEPDKKIVFIKIELEEENGKQEISCGEEEDYHLDIQDAYENDTSLIRFNFEYYWIENENVLVLLPTVTNNYDNTLYLPNCLNIYEIIINEKPFKQIYDYDHLDDTDPCTWDNLDLNKIIAVPSETKGRMQSIYIKKMDLPESHSIQIALNYHFHYEKDKIKTVSQPFFAQEAKRFCRLLRVPLTAQKVIMHN